MTTYFHRTDQAEAILRDGFRDASGNYMTAVTMFTGVWISNLPLDINEGAKGEQLLAIELDSDIGTYEVVEDASTYREWCVPAAILNAPGVSLRVVPQAEEDEWLMA